MALFFLRDVIYTQTRRSRQPQEFKLYDSKNGKPVQINYRFNEPPGRKFVRPTELPAMLIRSESEALKIINIEGTEYLLRGSKIGKEPIWLFEYRVNAMARWRFSDSGNVAIGNYYDPQLRKGVIRAHDGKTGEQLWLNTYEGKDGVLSHPNISIAQDGSKVALFRQREVTQVLDGRTGDLLFEFGPFDDVVSTYEFSPDGKMLACTCIMKMAHIVDTESQKVIHSFSIPFRGNFSDISPNGKVFVTGGDYNEVYVRGQYAEAPLTLWNLQSGEMIAQLDTKLRRVRFSPDGRQLLGRIADDAGQEQAVLVDIPAELLQWTIESAPTPRNIASSGSENLEPGSNREAAPKQSEALAAEFRTWTAADGAYSVRGKFLRRRGNEIIIQTPSLHTILFLPLSNLSDQDKLFLSEIE